MGLSEQLLHRPEQVLRQPVSGPVARRLHGVCLGGNVVGLPPSERVDDLALTLDDSSSEDVVDSVGSMRTTSRSRSPVRCTEWTPFTRWSTG
jgi:hypothetical protein